MVPLLKLSNVKKQAWAYYYALVFSWIYTTVIVNFARMNWNLTVSHSGHWSPLLYKGAVLSKFWVQIFKVLRTPGCAWLWLSGPVCLLCLCEEVNSPLLPPPQSRVQKLEAAVGWKSQMSLQDVPELLSLVLHLEGEPAVMLSYTVHFLEAGLGGCEGWWCAWRTGAMVEDRTERPCCWLQAGMLEVGGQEKKLLQNSIDCSQPAPVF